jgi:hypothetical protein
LQPADKFTSPSYNKYFNLLISYEMKLKTRYGDYTNKTKGKLTGCSSYEERLGKVTSSADLNKSTSWRLINDNSIEIVLDLEIIENQEGVGQVPARICELSSQYETLYNNDKYSDFTLVTSENEEIPVHKNILASRSPVFQVNFSN